MRSSNSRTRFSVAASLSCCSCCRYCCCSCCCCCSTASSFGLSDFRALLSSLSCVCLDVIDLLFFSFFSFFSFFGFFPSNSRSSFAISSNTAESSLFGDCSCGAGLFASADSPMFKSGKGLSTTCASTIRGSLAPLTIRSSMYNIVVSISPTTT
ncbi:hypothetical protein GQ42DRAFT_38274 [Ramicandelaber brevisporus]|nr:hypothetical protein GQ42DRAFT_38274 [Ramicandelaber brevisporus]